MNITLNGKITAADERTTLAGLIRIKCPDPKCVIAEVNERIVKRESWDACILNSGDCIELVTFVGGG